MKFRVYEDGQVTDKGEFLALAAFAVGLPVLIGTGIVFSQNVEQIPVSDLKMPVALHVVGECPEYSEHISELNQINITYNNPRTGYTTLNLRAMEIKTINYVERGNVQMLCVTDDKNNATLLPRRDVQLEYHEGTLDIQGGRCYLVVTPSEFKKAEEESPNIIEDLGETEFFDQIIDFDAFENDPSVSDL